MTDDLTRARDERYLEAAGWSKNEHGEWNRFSYSNTWTTFEHALVTERRWQDEQPDEIEKEDG